MFSDVHDNTSLKSVGYIDLFLIHINLSVFEVSKRLQKAFIYGVSKSVLKVTVMWLSEFGRWLKNLN